MSRALNFVRNRIGRPRGRTNNVNPVSENELEQYLKNESPNHESPNHEPIEENEPIFTSLGEVFKNAPINVRGLAKNRRVLNNKSNPHEVLGNSEPTHKKRVTLKSRPPLPPKSRISSTQNLNSATRNRHAKLKNKRNESVKNNLKIKELRLKKAKIKKSRNAYKAKKQLETQQLEKQQLKKQPRPRIIHL